MGTKFLLVKARHWLGRKANAAITFYTIGGIILAGLGYLSGAVMYLGLGCWFAFIQRCFPIRRKRNDALDSYLVAYFMDYVNNGPEPTYVQDVKGDWRGHFYVAKIDGDWSQ